MRKLVFLLTFLAMSVGLIAQEELPRMLSAEVNSGYDEWGPVVSPDGTALYFTRIGHPQNMGGANAADIWISYRYADGQWPRAVNAGAPLNGWQDDRIVGVHASGNKLYLYRPNSNALLYSGRRGRIWQPPMPIVIDSFKLEGKNVHFAFSPDGSVLMLSLAGKGNGGQRDIYVCFAQGENRYAPPKPLGLPVNSSADEVGLWLAADGETLYFSSDREGGLGGQDLYFTRRLDEKWSRFSTPQNLGAPVNTTEDDIFLSIPASGAPVYLLRRNEESALDIYEAALPDSLLPQPVILLTGTIKDAASGEALGPARPQLQSFSGHPLSPGAFAPGEDGRFQLILPFGENLELTAEMDGYFPVSAPLELSGHPLEELDRDNSPLLVSLSRDPAYVQRNEEIMELQLHLRQLDDELIRIREERRAMRQKIINRRLENPSWAPPSDPELDALRHRYGQYQAAARDTIVPDNYENAESSAWELRDMKERYNRYVAHQKQEQQAQVKAEEDKKYLWEKAPGFESLQKEVQESLRAGLTPEVSRELSAGMLEEVRQEVAQELSERERRQLELKEEALRRNIRQSFSGPAGKPEDWTARGGGAGPDWERELREDIKAAMEPKVREELQKELKEDIRAALSNDITYWAKKETKAELQGELNEKLQLQIEQERRKASGLPMGNDVVAPLEPPSASPAAYREVNRDLLLAPVKAGSVIPLNTVVFEPNKPTLKPVAYAELGRVLEFLHRNPGLSVEVGVHAGGQLSHANALGLTAQRAQAIVNYLIGHGIEEGRAIPKGYGKAFPVAEGAGPEVQRQNQRVEMRVIAITD